MRAYKFGQKWEIGQKSPASTCLDKTDAANPIKPFKTSSNQRFRKFWSLLLRMPEAGSFAIRVALAVFLMIFITAAIHRYTCLQQFPMINSCPPYSICYTLSDLSGKSDFSKSPSI